MQLFFIIVTGYTLLAIDCQLVHSSLCKYLHNKTNFFCLTGQPLSPCCHSHGLLNKINSSSLTKLYFSFCCTYSLPLWWIVVYSEESSFIRFFKECDIRVQSCSLEMFQNRQLCFWWLDIFYLQKSYNSWYRVTITDKLLLLEYEVMHAGMVYILMVERCLWYIAHLFLRYS